VHENIYTGNKKNHSISKKLIQKSKKG